MNCKDSEKLVHAYIDNELDAANTLLLEQHIQQCKQCRQEYEEFQQLRKTLKDSLRLHEAPSSLRNDIISRLAEQNGKGKHPTQNLPGQQIWLKASGIAALFVIGIFSVYLYLQHQTEEQLLDAILNGHINALNAERLTDIRSDQVQTLSGWFNSKLDYAPKIFNFDTDGYKIIGGRLDSLHNKRIASVTYQHKQHIVNLYTWPSPNIDDAAQEVHSKQGYHLLYWCQNNMNYWIVSDMNSRNLEQLASMVRQQLQ